MIAVDKNENFPVRNMKFEVFMNIWIYHELKSNMKFNYNNTRVQ